MRSTLAEISDNDDKAWLADQFAAYGRAFLAADVREDLIRLKELLLATAGAGRKVVIAGNGGSAATASHCAVDLTKHARVRCVNFNEADLITCFGSEGGAAIADKGLHAYPVDSERPHRWVVRPGFPENAVSGRSGQPDPRADGRNWRRRRYAAFQSASGRAPQPTTGCMVRSQPDTHPSEPIDGNGHVGERRADILSQCRLRVQKQVTY
jgi:hypothetical protein